MLVAVFVGWLFFCFLLFSWGSAGTSMFHSWFNKDASNLEDIEGSHKL